jgi:membrane-bound lytic murein transglycosylase D
VETFRANLETYDKPLVSWQPYQPKKGERLDQLAPKLGLSVETLKSVNGLSGRSNVSTGQTLLVPVNGEESETDSEFEAFNMHLRPYAEKTRTLSHTVRKGETLSSIARKYRVSVAKLKSWNEGVSKAQAGQTLTIVKAPTRKSRLSKAGKRSSKLAKRNSSRKQASRKTAKRAHVAYN